MHDGVYSVTMVIVKEAKAIFVFDDCITFEIHDVERTGHWWGKRLGAVRPNLNWQHQMSAGLGTTEEVWKNVPNAI